MEIISLPSFIPSKPEICITIGLFDGVHKGHRFLLDQLQTIAKKKQQKSAIITFRNPPRSYLQADYIPELLTSTEEKLELISQAGIDYCFLLDFTPEIADMTAEKFIREILSGQLNVKNLLIGYDHRFGKNRSEGFDDYVKYGQDCGIDVILAEELDPHLHSSTLPHPHINSTLIRSKIQNKAIAEANALLGYSYSLTGKVIHGNQLGRKIGYPTANLEITESRKIIPSEGIYAVCVTTGENSYPGMAYIGKRPTVSNQEEKRIEVHVLGFSGNLYGKIIRLEFVKYLRDDKQFDSLEELQKQLHQDREDALDTFFGQ
jgi:riboflavin kinase/FMN adenylyltransferase